MKLSTLLLVALLLAHCAAAGDQGHRSYTTSTLTDATYTVIDAYPCVRLLNSTGTIGCGQNGVSVSGTLQMFTGTPEEFVAQHRNTIVVMEPDHFTRENVVAVANKDDVSGIALLYGESARGYSPDLKQPNVYVGAEFLGGFEWNSVGDGLMYDSFDIPIWLIGNNYSEAIRVAAKNNDNGVKPFYGLRLKTSMNAGGDTETCFRRGKCLPVGGQSVISALTFPNSSLPYVMVMARLDAVSMFHDVVPAGNAYMSGVVTLLTAQLALAEYLGPNATLEKNLVFAYFNGEAWGYLGSRKFVHDTLHFKCGTVNASNPSVCDEPFKSSMIFDGARPSNIEALIDISQLGGINTEDPKVFIHTLNAKEELSSHFQNVPADDTSVKFSFVPPETIGGIPPSSAIPFLVEKKDIPTYVIADHEGEFVNKNYNSHMDLRRYTADTLCQTSNLVARSLYTLATGKAASEIDLEKLAVNCTLVEELMLCMTSNFVCNLTQTYLGEFNTDHYQIPHYSGVFGYSLVSRTMNYDIQLVQRMLLTNVYTEKAGACAQTADCAVGFVCANSTCTKTPTILHNAVDPAITYDGDWVITDKTQPLLTESYWNLLEAAIYVEQSLGGDLALFFAGLCMFVVSFAAVYYARKYFTVHYKIN